MEKRVSYNFESLSLLYALRLGYEELGLVCN